MITSIFSPQDGDKKPTCQAQKSTCWQKDIYKLKKTCYNVITERARTKPFQKIIKILI